MISDDKPNTKRAATPAEIMARIVGELYIPEYVRKSGRLKPEYTKEGDSMSDSSAARGSSLLKLNPRINGINDATEEVGAALDSGDAERAEEYMRRIAGRFKFLLNASNASTDQVEALEWFEQDTPRHALAEGDIKAWRDEYDYNIDRLFDWAASNGVWVS